MGTDGLNSSSRVDVIPLERRLDWELTTQCNLRCTHCISRYFHESVPQELSEVEAHQVIERCHEAGVNAIHFFGGEPTMRPDLGSLLEHCDALGIISTFNTNGTRLDEDLLETLAEMRHRRPILVSFEDIRKKEADAIRGPGSYDAALEGVRRLRAALPEPAFVIAFTLTRPAIEALSPTAILEFFADLGAARLVFQDLAVPPDASSDLSRLAYDGTQWLDFVAELHLPARPPPIPFGYRLKPLVIEYLNTTLGASLPLVYSGCNGLSTELRLLPNGTLLPCSAAVGWPEVLALYLEETPTLPACHLEEILASEQAQRFLDLKLARGLDPTMKPCRQCPFAFVQCNPCVFGRFTGQAHTIQTCEWVSSAGRSHSRRDVPLIER